MSLRATLLLLIWFGVAAHAAEPAPTKPDSKIPYRTDSTGEQLPWYQLKPGEFPPLGSEHRVSGELVEADFVHRSGQFRSSATGELVDFTMPPFGLIKYLGAEADLRDVPLRTSLEWFLYQDDRGAFTRAVVIRDTFTQLAAEGFSYRLDELKLDEAKPTEGKLAVTKQCLSHEQLDLGHSELAVNGQTRVWNGDKQAKLGDVIKGDQLLVNLRGGGPGQPSRCCDIWIGADAQKLVTERQRKQHKDFLKVRGLTAWIDRVDGKQLTVTLLGDPAGAAALCKDEGIVPAQWATEHRYIDTVVANDELRTYNPPVDRERSRVVDFQSVPTDCHGSSGLRWVIEPELLLEGFRKGRVVRLFAHPSWPVNDMPFGEGLYTEMPGAKIGLEEPHHYPYRTDFANERLPWYRLKAGQFPPLRSQHSVFGELLSVDTQHRSGQFRADRTGELVNFSMPPYGAAFYRNAPADLADLPLGTRYEFFLYQNDHGAFTIAAVIKDDFSRLAEDRMSYRVESIDVEAKTLVLATQLGMVKNDKDALYRPPDIGRREFDVDDNTRVWKADKQASLSDLAIGDELLVNLSGCAATDSGRSTEIWIGAKTHELAAKQQNAKFGANVKQRGYAGWIENIQGSDLTIVFFTGPGDEFQSPLNDGPAGGKLMVMLVSDELIQQGTESLPMKFKSSQLRDVHAGTYGCRGTQWIVEAAPTPKDVHVGQVVRVFDPAWATK